MAETVTMPKLGFDMQEGTLVRWVRAEGESIDKGDVLAEIETDKATVEVESSAAGVIRRLLVDQGAVVPIGAPIAIIGTKDEKIESPTVPVPSPTAEVGTAAPTPPVAKPSPPPLSAQASLLVTAEAAGAPKASPLARRLALAGRVDLNTVVGTGPGGRIVRKDIEAAMSASRAPAATEAARSAWVPQSAGPRADEVVPLSKLRMAIARRMTESKTTAPHFYVTHEYRVDSLLDLRQQANSMLPDDQKISLNDFVIKAVALCLREFPNLNSAYQGGQVLRHGSINVGVAVAVEGGLLTVVCQDADQKPLQRISDEVRAMVARARAGKVHPEDIEGSTFSISNLGMFEVENFAAIINPPEAGILAVGGARQVPVVIDGRVEVGWRMKATISVDHRVSDGAEAARFMQALAQFIETPLRLFL